MAAPALRRDALPPRYRRVPWSPAAWRQTLFLVGGIPAQIVALFVVMTPIIAVHPRWPLPLLGLALVFIALPWLTRIQRHRLRVTAGVVIPPRPGIPNRLSLQGLAAAARSRATWQQAGYHLLAAPALAVAAVAAFAAWLTGVVYTLVYVYAGSRAPGKPAAARPVGSAALALRACASHSD